MPTFCGRRTDKPQVGSNPTRACVSAKRACSDAIRMSQYRANSRPPVTAAPLIAPITGLFIGGHCGEMSGSSVESPSSLRSSPAQNTGSVPVRMTTSTSSSASASRSAPKKRLRSSLDNALRACGRFSVRARTRSWVSISSTSVLLGLVMDRTYRGRMCRNITELRGLEPAATAEEIEAAARQYVRKVSGVTRPSGANVDAFETAVAEVTEITTRLLDGLEAGWQDPN